MGTENSTIMYKKMLEESLRTIQAQGKVFSIQEMREYRIRAIYNSIGGLEEMDDVYMQMFALGVHRPEEGEVAIIESSIRGVLGSSNPSKVVSVLVFRDLYSWHRYAIRFKDMYMKDKENLLSLLN